MSEYTDPTREQLAQAIESWQRDAQQMLNAIAAEQTAWLALSSTPTSMWLAAHHSWQIAAETARKAVHTMAGSEWSWLEPTAYDYLYRCYQIDEYDIHRLLNRYELDQRPITAMDNQLREALGSYAARDYLTQLDHRSEIAGRTLVASALLAS